MCSIVTTMFDDQNIIIKFINHRVIVQRRMHMHTCIHTHTHTHTHTCTKVNGFSPKPYIGNVNKTQLKPIHPQFYKSKAV